MNDITNGDELSEEAVNRIIQQVNSKLIHTGDSKLIHMGDSKLIHMGDSKLIHTGDSRPITVIDSKLISCNDNNSNKTSNSGFSDSQMALTANEQTLLTSWCTYCHENSELHYNCWSFYKLMNNITSIPSLIFSSLAGISILSMIADTTCTRGQVIIIYIMGSFGMFSGIMFAINKFYRFPELVELHDVFSHNYEIIQNDIVSNISLTKDFVFKSPSEFIKHMRSQLRNVIERAPPIPKYIRKRFLRKKAKLEYVVTTQPNNTENSFEMERSSYDRLNVPSLVGLPIYSGTRLNKGSLRVSMSGL